MATRIDICNRAIARLPANPIQSLDETSLEARECNRFYPQVMSDMLEGPIAWSFQNKRLLLAGINNDRPIEWLYAYAVPADMGQALRVIPDFSGAGFGVPFPLPGDPYAERWAFGSRYWETPYILDAGVIYTNVPNAALEYGVSSVDESKLSQTVAKAMGLQLAAEISIPIKKDKQLRMAILQEAEVAWQRAMAEDFNRQPTQSDDYVSESMLARHCSFPGDACF